jgi:hypothetical protein
MRSLGLTTSGMTVSLLLLAFSCFVGPARGDDPPVDARAQGALENFLSALAGKAPERAYSHVAPETKKKGDPIAYGAKADYDSFLAEVKSQPAAKFGAFKLGKQRTVSKAEVRIFVHFEGGDNDETLIVKVGDRWYVADPIHIIR